MAYRTKTMMALKAYADQARRYAGARSGRFVFCGPDHVQIGITDRCNFKCIYCTIHSDLIDPSLSFGPGRTQNICHRENPATLSLEAYKECIDGLVKMNCRKVSLIGFGEPFFHKQIMDIIHESKTRGVKLHIVSNGSLISEEKAVGLVGTLDHLNISIDSGNQETHTKVHRPSRDVFEQILETLGRIQEIKRERGSSLPALSLSTVLCRENYREVEDIFRMAMQLRIHRVDFSIMGAVDQTEYLQIRESDIRTEEMQDLFTRAKGLIQEGKIQTNLFQALASYELGGPRTKNIQKDLPCYIGWLFLRIFPNGDVHPCCGCDSVLGNIHERSIIQIWKSRGYREFRGKMSSLPKSGGFVQGCRCHDCGQTPINVRVHGKLHPLKNRLFNS